jgi:hypothetical protein
MPKLRAPEQVCARAAALAHDIEAELHALGLWQDDPPAPTLRCSFTQRLEFEVLPLLELMAVGGVERPEQTSLGTRGVVEYAHRPACEHLEQLLFEVDRLIRGYRIEYAAAIAARQTHRPRRVAGF